MSGPPAPPPSGSAAPYQSTTPYQSPPPSGSTTVQIPSWLDFGVLISLVGAILVIVGFAYGYQWGVDAGSTPPPSNTWNQISNFFAWTGAGIFLIVFGWIVHVMWPVMMAWMKSRASKPAAAPPAPGPAYTPAPEMAPAAMAAAPAAAAQPAPMAAPVAATTPACTNCGKPTTYIAQYGRYYCYSCARYV